MEALEVVIIGFSGVMRCSCDKELNDDWLVRDCVDLSLRSSREAKLAPRRSKYSLMFEKESEIFLEKLYSLGRVLNRGAAEFSAATVADSLNVPFAVVPMEARLVLRGIARTMVLNLGI